MQPWPRRDWTLGSTVKHVTANATWKKGRNIAKNYALHIACVVVIANQYYCLLSTRHANTNAVPVCKPGLSIIDMSLVLSFQCLFWSNTIYYLAFLLWIIRHNVRVVDERSWVVARFALLTPDRHWLPADHRKSKTWPCQYAVTGLEPLPDFSCMNHLFCCLALRLSPSPRSMPVHGINAELSWMLYNRHQMTALCVINILNCCLYT